MHNTTREIYVGDFAYETTERDLERLFANYGAVISVQIVTDYFTRQSKGFGYVQMGNAIEAQQAVENLDGEMFRTNRIVVKHSRSCYERQGSRW